MSELAKALAEFQAAQTGLELDKKGNRSQYASVGSVMTKVKQAAQHGLSFSQLVDYEDGVGPAICADGSTWHGRWYPRG